MTLYFLLQELIFYVQIIPWTKWIHYKLCIFLPS
jgi:hypothetical protein